MINENFRLLFLTDSYHPAPEEPAPQLLQSEWQALYEKYRDDMRNLGHLIGYQFRNIFSIGRQDYDIVPPQNDLPDHLLYVFPESEVTVSLDPDFDVMIFPNWNYSGEYPAFEKV